MKYLVAFALLAVAVALPEPLRLLDPLPVDIAPLVVPQEAMDEVALTVKVVDAPEPQAVEDARAYGVKIVEEASYVETAPVAEDVAAYAVNFVEAAVNAEPSPVDAAEDVSAFAVNFVDEAINFEIPAAINIQVPLPNSVVLPLDSIVLPSVDAVMVADSPVGSTNAAAFSPVKVVDIADVDEETPSYVPIKQYPDPRWR